MNSTWVVTSELANQRARKALFTCVVYTNRVYWLLTVSQIWCLVQGANNKRLFCKTSVQAPFSSFSKLSTKSGARILRESERLALALKTLWSLGTQKVSGSQRKTLVSRSRKVSRFPFATPQMQGEEIFIWGEKGMKNRRILVFDDYY